jgi:hypothetical protein
MAGQADDSHSGCQEILHLLMNPNLHYRVVELKLTCSHVIHPFLLLHLFKNVMFKIVQAWLLKWEYVALEVNY